MTAENGIKCNLFHCGQSWIELLAADGKGWSAWFAKHHGGWFSAAEKGTFFKFLILLFYNDSIKQTGALIKFIWWILIVNNAKK